jgi:hypothetical protein
MVVNAGKAAVVESKCSPRTGGLPHCSPESDPALERRQRRGVYYPSEQLQASFRQSMVEAAARRRRNRSVRRHASHLRYSSSLCMKLWVNDHTPSPGMALCGYSVGISQIIWARTAAGCSSKERTASIRKSSTVPPDSHGAYLTRSVLLANQTMRCEFHAAIFVIFVVKFPVLAFEFPVT